MQRILSISGLRGVVGDGLDPNYVVRFAQALGLLAERGTVVVGRDGRVTGPMLKRAVLAGLESVGCRVIDAGITATPTCGFLVRHLKASAGIEITASHNPVEWNGLKPFSSEGAVFDEARGKALLALLGQESFELSRWNGIGRTEVLPDAGDTHLAKVLELVDVEAIRRRRLNVVLDCNHGSGSVLGPKLLAALGCDVIVLGGTPDGVFEHPAEPLKENLVGLCEAVRSRGADIGFAQDPDADRLAIVDNRGRYIGEELTLALCADYVLSRTPGALVVNGSSSRVSADVAARHHSAFHRSAVGEANVVARMREVKAVLGGEGNGGVIEPRVGFVRDSLVGIAYVAAELAGTGGSQPRQLAEWVDSLPVYSIVKDKLVCPADRVGDACQALEKKYPDATATRGDGLRLDWPDRWVQVRASNTEPILRVIAEAPDETRANALCSDAMTAVREAVS
ncbi:MAG TPA: phosphoglucosamine mutase [Planctomycetaceae bacterium]|jgi:phosphomannomutase|nr:phosphoglucosamine mutase [Planctomycetaceae bacterium]